MSTVDVNGTELYYERRGAGPSLLLIMGATGDGGAFERFADLLAEEFTVVTYDRRGNGRSPQPPGWETTSPEEQADDAAALLDALGLAPAAVFGTSSGGIFALVMLLRHSQAVRAPVLHEPALFSLFDDAQETRTRVTEIVTAAIEAGGPPAAFECFLRFFAGEATWEHLDPSVREPMLASAGTYFGSESGRFDTYLPGRRAAGRDRHARALARRREQPRRVRPSRRPACAAPRRRCHARTRHTLRVRGSPSGAGADRERTASDGQPLTLVTR